MSIESQGSTVVTEENINAFIDENTIHNLRACSESS